MSFTDLLRGLSPAARREATARREQADAERAQREEERLALIDRQLGGARRSPAWYAQAQAVVQRRLAEQQQVPQPTLFAQQQTFEVPAWEWPTTAAATTSTWATIEPATWNFWRNAPPAAGQAAALDYETLMGWIAVQSRPALRPGVARMDGCIELIKESF